MATSRSVVFLGEGRGRKQLTKDMKGTLKQRIEEILARVITRETHKGTHARVVVQTTQAIIIAIKEMTEGEK